MAAYKDILAIDPRDAQALGRLSVLAGQRLSAGTSWSVLLSERAEQAAAEGARSEAAELRLQLAEIHEQHLEDFSKSIVDYQVALKDLPANPRIVSGLERLLQRVDGAADKALIAELLEPLYDQSQNAQGLVSILQARAEGTSPGPDRAAILRRVAGLYLGPLNSPEMAFFAASQALRDDPEAPGAVELAIQAGERAQVAEELAQLLEELQDKIRASRPFLALHWALAQLYEGPLQSHAKAIQEWRKVVERNPDDQDAVDQLSALYLANDDVPALLELLRRQLAVSEEVGTRSRLLRRIGEIQADRQKDLAQAFVTFRKLIELLPADREAYLRLDDLAVSQQRWPELAGLLEIEAQLAKAQGDAASEISFLERLAELREGALRDSEGAIRIYAQLLGLVPSHPRSVERLEAILAREPQNLAVAELLEKVHKSGQNWAKVAETLEARASGMADPQARREVWLELAKIREEQLGRPDLAFLALARGFKDDPGDPALASEVERIAGAG